jgi:hypothetical protein
MGYALNEEVASQKKSRTYLVRVRISSEREEVGECGAFIAGRFGGISLIADRCDWDFQGFILLTESMNRVVNEIYTAVVWTGSYLHISHRT